MTTVVQIVAPDEAVRRRRESIEDGLRHDIEGSGAEAFPLVVEGPDLGTTAQILLQAFGLGPIRANTILLNWLEQVPATDAVCDARRYGAYRRATIRLGCNVVVLATDGDAWDRQLAPRAGERRIDVCWCDDASSRFALLLAYLMTRSDDWSGAAIRVVAGAGSQAPADAARARLRQMLDEVRIEATAVVTDRLWLDPDDVKRFYAGFSNGVLWPSSIPSPTKCRCACRIGTPTNGARREQGHHRRAAARADAIRHARRRHGRRPHRRGSLRRAAAGRGGRSRRACPQSRGDTPGRYPDARRLLAALLEESRAPA